MRKWVARATRSSSSVGWGETTGRSAGPSAISGPGFAPSPLMRATRDRATGRSSVHHGRHGRRRGRLARGDRGEPGARRGPIVGGPGRPGAGLAPSRLGEEPGSGFDTRRWRPLAQGGDRIVGLAAAHSSRSAHSPGRSFPGWSRPRFTASRPRSRDWSSSPSGTRGRKIPRRSPARRAPPPNTTRETGSGRFRCLAWSWSASSTWSTRPGWPPSSRNGCRMRRWSFCRASVTCPTSRTKRISARKSSGFWIKWMREGWADR